MFRLRHVLFCLVLLLSTLAQAAGIEGTYRLLKDSGGTTIKAGAVVEISFAKSTFTFKAVQPGETVEDKGTYRLIGKTITITFQELEQGRQTGPYTLADGVLTLPFKMFSSGKGTSTWQNSDTIPATNEPSGGTLAEVLAAHAGGVPEAGQRQGARQGGPAGGSGRGRREGRSGGILLRPGVALLHEVLFLRGLVWLCEGGQAGAHQRRLPQQPGHGAHGAGQVRRRSRDPQGGHGVVPAAGSALGQPGDRVLEDPRSRQGGNGREAGYLESRPTPGSIIDLYGKILKEKGRKQEAQEYFDQAWALGYAGSGREGEPGAGEGDDSGAGAAAPGTSPGEGSSGSPSKGNPGNPTPVKPPTKPSSAPKDKPFPAEWVGHYEAKYVRARSGESGKEANTQFGKGLTGTNVNLQTLACAKSFSMDVSSSGTITGQGKVMFVYQGKAVNPAMGLTPAALMVGKGGFGTNLKDGYQIRDWPFTGTVDANGNVEIKGMPEGQLDLLNVGRWQKISPWSPLPPDGPGAAMRGPFHMTLVTGRDSGPQIRVDQWLALNDKLIRKVHYQAFIVKSDQELTPDCQYVKPKEAKCPASEYIKTKVSVSPAEGVTVETSNTFTAGKDGSVDQKQETTTKVGTSTLNVETSGKINAEGSSGMFTGSIKVNPTDGSYAVSVGVGVDTSQVLKGSSAKISEKVELVYDSKCGWGIKGTAGAKVGKVGGSVEGAVYFNKGI